MLSIPSTLSCYKCRVQESKQRLYRPKSQKHLLSSPLQETFANTWIRARSPELKGPGSYSSSLLYISECLGNLITLSVLQFPESDGDNKKSQHHGILKMHSTYYSFWHALRQELKSWVLLSCQPASSALQHFPALAPQMTETSVYCSSSILPNLCLLNPLPHPLPSATPQDLLDLCARPSTYPNPPTSRISISSYFSVASDTADHIPLGDGLPHWEYPSKVMVRLLQLLQVLMLQRNTVLLPELNPS